MGIKKPDYIESRLGALTARQRRQGVMCLWAVVLLLSCLALLPSAVWAADSYDLGKAVERALAENFTIVASQATMEAAEEGRKAARSAFGPTVGTGYTYVRRQHKPSSLGLVQDADLFSWTISLQQNVFAGFATLSSYQKAALQKEVADAGYANARLDLIRIVQENFFAYLKAQENVRSAEDSLTRLMSQLQRSQSFYDVGLTPRLDVLQAEVDVSEAESILLLARHALSLQHARLNTLLNLPLEDAVSYVGSLDFIPYSATLDQCLAIAYSKRPDVLMAAKAVEISYKDKALVESGYYPQVNAEWAWVTQGDEWSAAGMNNASGVGVGSGLDAAQNYSAWTAGVSAQWSVFEWGRTYYSAQQAGKIVNRTKAEEANLRLDVALEVQSRLLDLDAADKRIKVARKGLEQAREAYRMATARYESQVGAFNDVLDAQANLTLAEATLTGSQADYLTALSALYNAMGLAKHDLKAD